MIVAAACFAAGAVVAQAAPPVFGVETNLVRIEVAAAQPDTSSVGLGQLDGPRSSRFPSQDFLVWDNGVPQQLQPVLMERLPADVVFVLDTSASVVGPTLDRLRDAAGVFLQGLHGDERCALVTFSEEVRLAQPWTDDRERMQAALGGISGRGSTALCDAVYLGLRLADTGARRAAVVVFSDGLDDSSWLSADEVVAAARRAGPTVYAVVARGQGQRAQPFLQNVARATGGRLFTAGEQDLRARFLDVLEDIRNRYLLSYSPQGVPEAGWHTLVVKLKGGRGQLLVRPGYWR
jgi:Ca-activated chloride channel family protein